MSDLKPIHERPRLSENQVHPNPILNRILQNRGVESEADLRYSLADLIDPFLMKGMREAVELLHHHLNRNSKIVVVGDFDCDGATSTSIAVEGLTVLGFENVSYIIPDRVVHGYGLSPSVVKLAEELEPDLIVTVDNGIASFDGAEAVKRMERDCDLLITDHHLPSEQGVPDATCIVNPSQVGCDFPSKAIAGCGVMFYVVMAFRAHLREVGHFQEKGVDQPSMGPLLDLVALGTVADVVPLDKNNRILVDAGIKRIRAGRGRPGIRAILSVAKRDEEKIIASDFGFAVGPRINAAGRLEGMEQGIECLLSQDFQHALELAQRLDELNQQRRDIEADHLIDAEEIISKHKLREKKGVVIHDPTWHAGVVGIVSSRIKEKINRPVICMTDTAEAEELRHDLALLEGADSQNPEIKELRQKLDEADVKGSARSIPGVHLKHVLDNISKKNPEILSKFGGHAMAAGLSVKYKHLQTFMDLFDQEIASVVTPEQLLGSIDVDIKDVSGELMDMDLAREIRTMGPWGQAFPEPVFHGKFQILNHRILKGKHLKMSVAFHDRPGVAFDTISFNCIENDELPVGETFEGSFQLDINEYPPGRENLQLMIRELQDKPFELVKKVEEKPSIEEKTPSVKMDKEKLDSMADHEARHIREQGLSKQESATSVTGFRDELQSIVEQMQKRKESMMKNNDSTPSF